MGKKIITLLLCMLMIIGMLSSFAVFAEDTNEPVVIYEINYNSDADLAADKISWFPANAAASIDTAEHFEGAGSLKFEFDKDSTKDVRLCNINGTAFKKGANYVVSFYAKASAPVAFKFMCGFANNGNRIISGGSEIAYPGAFPKLTTDWKKYTIRFNIDSFKNGNDEYVAEFLVEANNFSAGDKLWIDKIEVLEGINPVAPVAENVKISGSAQVSKTLTASADITDANKGDILSAKYQWQYQDGEVWKDISGAASETYTIPEEMIGKKLRVLVTPLSDNEPKEGVPVASAATGEITAFSYPPSAKDVKLSGEAKIGSTIEASYIYI